MMNPPWDLDKITNQARWAVLRALLILKDHKTTYEALVQALQKGKDLGKLSLCWPAALFDHIETIFCCGHGPVFIFIFCGVLNCIFSGCGLRPQDIV